MIWPAIAAFMLVGYLSMSRSFAYWGIPPFHIFVGEIVLGCFLLWGPTNHGKRWLWNAMKHPKLRRFRILFSIFFVYGIFQVMRGIAVGHPPFSSVRDFAFNYYPLYFFLGLWVGLIDREFLPNLVRSVAWVNGIYGVLFIFGLSRIPLFWPGVSEQVEKVPIFGEPMFSAVILLGLISFEKNLSRVWLPLVLNATVLIGMLIRAEWVELFAGLLIWAWVTRNFKRVVIAGSIVVFLFGLMYITNFSYVGPETRGGTISAREIVARVIAPISSDTAGNYGDSASDLNMYESNVVWRTLWWASIWTTVHEDRVRAFLGLGYGFPLGDLVPYLEDAATRTPHNVFFFALGYTGWLGVMVFGAFQFEIARLLWIVRHKTEQPFGFVFWAAIMVFACFTPFFETPQGAIPFYLIVGCATAPLFLKITPATDKLGGSDPSGLVSAGGFAFGPASQLPQQGGY